MWLSGGEDRWYGLWSWCWGRGRGFSDPHALGGGSDEFSDSVGEG